MTLRKYKYPIFIGTGIVLAGSLMFFAKTRVNPEQTQGAIGQRDVYREGQVAASDVSATPGAAPVATKALLESKDFATLAKNPAFQSLVSNESFKQLAKAKGFAELMKNEAFLQMAQNSHFHELLQIQATQGSSQALATMNSHQLSNELARCNAQSLANNAAFLNLIADSHFNAVVSQNLNMQAMANLVSMNSFHALANNSSFQNLVSNQSFMNAMQSGRMAELTANSHIRY